MDLAYSINVCSATPGFAASSGVSILDADAWFTLSSKEPTAEEAEAAIVALRDAGATVLIGCTYASTALPLLAAAKALGWSPLAMVFTSVTDVSDPGPRSPSTPLYTPSPHSRWAWLWSNSAGATDEPGGC